MNQTGIEGVVNADSTQGYAWNPFVGCLNGCSYCWARKSLARSKCELCRKFTPHWHAERMEQPYTLKRPSTIAVCWMGDVWRDGMEVVRSGPDWEKGPIRVPGDLPPKYASQMVSILHISHKLFQHVFLFLTRDPRGYCYKFPLNSWLGITVTSQEDVDRIGPDFAAIDHPNKFVSYEPMLGEIRDWGKLGRFGWLYMGALTDGRGRVVLEPAFTWLVNARRVASDCGAKVWEKRSLSYLAAENMVELGGLELRKETPWLRGPE